MVVQISVDSAILQGKDALLCGTLSLSLKYSPQYKYLQMKILM